MIVAPVLSTALKPGSTNGASQAKILIVEFPTNVITGLEVDAANKVMLSEVEELVLPSPSVADTERVLAPEARPTEAFQFPEPLTVAELVPVPPVIFTVELASAVPEIVIGFVLVECGVVGNVTIGDAGPLVS